MEPELTTVQPLDSQSEDHALNVLFVMRRQEFVLSVKRAEAEAVRAERVRDNMNLWLQRLLPYLDRDPRMTVADALKHYRMDESSEAQQPGHQ